MHEAYQIMEDLTGTWAVPQSDNIFTIHRDRTWTTHVFGASEDRQIPVSIISYYAASRVLYLTIDGKDSKVYIIGDYDELRIVNDGGIGTNFISIRE
ncbi:hypothetical protein ACYSNO_10025 [Enterococcus sp. LJL98]